MLGDPEGVAGWVEGAGEKEVEVEWEGEAEMEEVHVPKREGGGVARGELVTVPVRVGVSEWEGEEDSESKRESVGRALRVDFPSRARKYFSMTSSSS